MNDLVAKINEAKSDTQALDVLVSDYVPFIKKEIGRFSGNLSYDEKLSIAMLVFVNCVRQYEEPKGNFISFVSISIKNRLMDQIRTNKKEMNLISLDAETEEEHPDLIENKISVQVYEKEQEEQSLKDEIELFDKELRTHDISFKDLEKSCPKQMRSRTLCIGVAKEMSTNSSMMNSFKRTGRIPQAELALRQGISIKSIEKYRKYIVALVILYNGDYGGITSFIPFLTGDKEK